MGGLRPGYIWDAELRLEGVGSCWPERQGAGGGGRRSEAAPTAREATLDVDPEAATLRRRRCRLLEEDEATEMWWSARRTGERTSSRIRWGRAEGGGWLAWR